MTEESDDERDPTVLTPEELELQAETGVEQIDENRFVVNPSGEPAPSTDRSGPAAPDAERPDYAESENQASAGESEEMVSEPPREPGAQSSRTESPSGRDDRGVSTPKETQSIDELGDATAFSPEARGVALEHMDRSHAIDVLLKTDDGIVERRIAADDRITVFEELLTWYANTIDDDNAPATTISALLAEADLNS